VTERNCGNCRHFVKIESAATGHCTNPLVVSHQGQLVMYRAGEIGCRRGWKQDLWEQGEDVSTPVAATPDVPLDYGRAAAWADSAPTRNEPAIDLFASDSLDDDELLDPRRTRDIREAMRRAREMKRREQITTSRRDPIDQPILGSEPVAGTDSVLHVQPAPAERVSAPIVAPVSVDEVRQRVDEMRQPRHYNDPPPSIHFEQYDEYFNVRADAPILLPDPVEPRRRPTAPARQQEAIDVSVEPAFTPAEPLDEPAFSFEPYEPEIDRVEDAPRAYVTTADYDDMEETAWPEQAPWADEQTDDVWSAPQPRRRSWISNLIHRQPRPRPIDPRESAFTWEPEVEEIGAYDQEEAIAAEPWIAADALDVDRAGRAPEFGAMVEADGRDDYLLADGRFADFDEEDPAARQIDHICATCRYFRPDGTCGNAFAFTYRRRVSDEYLSCSSSIGAWWLPSDHYWESVVTFSHHGQPTPLLDRYEIQANRPDSDDEIRTP
jgi:hypothetical protein